jgi:ribosomal protein S20
VEDLRPLITRGVKISHDYLLSLTDRDKLTPSVARKRAHLASLENALKEIRAWLVEEPFAGATQWKQNLAKFDKAVKAGAVPRPTVNRKKSRLAAVLN